MQIELIGCTSAGKSRFAQKMLKSNNHNGLHLVTSYDFVIDWAHLDWVKNHRIRMLFLNLIALSACLLTWRSNLNFYRFVIGVILRLPADVRPFEKLKIARIAARNVGIFEIVRRNSYDHQVVLADEGTLQIAHYLFVHVSVEPNMSDLETFVRLVSLPEVAVYIEEPESVLISRTRKRGHKRIPENMPALVDRFIKHGIAVFDKLVESPALEGKVLIVPAGKDRKPAWDYPVNPSLDFARKILALNDEVGPMSRENFKPVRLDLGHL
jgi:hypothetical protein